jgi:hypothetical protein
LRPQNKSTVVRILDIVFLLGGLTILLVFTTLYLMPFRLDDVLHMDWARENSFWDAFNVGRGEIVRSVRPVFAMTIWLLTHTAGVHHYFLWHFVLVGSFLIGLAYTGKTARYIAVENSALYFTTGFFWIAFLPILNVLFWYGDLTYTLELLFIAPAWYYGLRGLLEGRIGLWATAILCGIMAVLAKEPALILVHTVMAGIFLLCYKNVKKAWINKSREKKILAVLLYAVFLFISLKLYFASPTKSNRFFDINTLPKDQLLFFINDRLRYYAEALLNPLARILLITPLIYFIIRSFIKNNSLLRCSLILLVSLIISFLLIKSLIFFAIILLVASILKLTNGKGKQAGLLLLPFTLCAILILAVLLITVMLVKTQLIELSFVLLIISGVYWSEIGNEITFLTHQYWIKKSVRVAFYSLFIFILFGGLYFAFPTLKAKERLLSDVRDVRSNANDAIKWMGEHLPPSSSLLVTSPGLYGLGKADEMTSKDDEYKLYAQYTFLQGYTRSYLHALKRYDISLGFLEDSILLSRVLDSCRSAGGYYLFLQTGLDNDRFHDKINGKAQLSDRDTLLARFSKGPYPSEVWKLGE